MPPPEAFAAVAADLGALPDRADAGALARRLNTEVAGARSLVMSTYRALPLEGAADAGRRQGETDRAGRALDRGQVLAGHRQERLALDR